MSIISKLFTRGEDKKKMNTLTMTVDSLDSLSEKEEIMVMFKVKVVELVNKFLQFLQNQLLKKLASLEKKLKQVELKLVCNLEEANGNVSRFTLALESNLNNIVEEVECSNEEITIRNLYKAEDALERILGLLDKMSEILKKREYRYVAQKTIASLINITNRNTNRTLSLLAKVEHLNELTQYRSLEACTKSKKKLWFFIIFGVINFLPIILRIPAIFEVPSFIFSLLGLYSIIGCMIVWFHYRRNKQQYAEVRNGIIET